MPGHASKKTTTRGSGFLSTQASGPPGRGSYILAPLRLDSPPRRHRPGRDPWEGPFAEPGF